MKDANLTASVLVVDDDEVLLRVLDGVLVRAGFQPLPATTVADALKLADRAPDIALIDRCLPDGDGVELARRLHDSRPGLPMILMSAYPTQLAEQGALFARVLEKPMDLDVLRESLQTALNGKPMKAPTLPAAIETKGPPTATLDSTPEVRLPASSAEVLIAKHDPGARMQGVRSAGVLVLAALVLVAFIGHSIGIKLPGMAAEPEEKTVKAPPPLAVRLVPGEPRTLTVPQEVRVSLGIRKGDRERIEVVAAPREPRPLTLYGSTALDPNRIMRIRARFAPAEVVQIGQTAEPPGETKSGKTEFRELRTGDTVSKGDVLGVFFSVDVGSKKNDLLDALVQLQLDQKILDRVDENRQAVPEVYYQNQMRLVQSDRNNISRALNMLKVWNIPQDEIDALHDEAKKIGENKSAWHKTAEGRWVQGEKQGGEGPVDPDKNNDNLWGKVTLRAPDDGVIVERNLGYKHETIQDPTICLFQIAQVNRLLIVANVPEDDLPKLQNLSRDKRRWKIRTLTGYPQREIEGTIDEFSYLIDVNQHSAVVKGYIDNPDKKLVAGQFITASVEIDPPKDVVEVPINAIIDEGRQCLVFVQTNAEQQHYQLRRVVVTQRFDKTAYVKSALTAAEANLTQDEADDGLLPPQPLEKGARVLTVGALELRKELDDLMSRAAEKPSR
jgi:cobalt-zinc-cadmium efflux system membrane fusion protein